MLLFSLSIILICYSYTTLYQCTYNIGVSVYALSTTCVYCTFILLQPVLIMRMLSLLCKHLKILLSLSWHRLRWRPTSFRLYLNFYKLQTVDSIHNRCAKPTSHQKACCYWCLDVVNDAVQRCSRLGWWWLLLVFPKKTGYIAISIGVAWILLEWGTAEEPLA